ncbi:MAG TPA: HAD family hydrolase [Pseudomonadota bacterium]|nr:HAD family hydrolase [Pseudomonadota bacterium]
MSDAEADDKVVILDRDGTIVIDRGYLGDPEGLQFEPQAAEALQWLHAHGYRLVVITNQSGVGRGYFTLDRLEAMNTRLAAMVQESGARLAGIYYCPHAPEEGCACRKPAQGLLERAASELGFDPAAAVVIGDKASDIEFGRRAGAMTILIAAEAPPASSGAHADYIAPNLMAAARIVTSERRARGAEPRC